MLCFPNAKINIGLNIVEKRDDGFHNIESIFFPVKLCDVLEAVVDESSPAGGVSFASTGISIPGNEDENLCVKAYHLISNDYPMPALKIHLHKVIPIGAGLGGGSSDAAFFINLLNELFELNLAWGEKHHYARQLGSDCPFFVANKPAFAFERGDKLDFLDVNLKGYHLVLIHPGIHVSTPLAYSLIKPAKPATSLKELIQLPVEEWKEKISNDFEKPVIEKSPEIAAIRDELYKAGAVYASMSGSGSAVFGIFKNKPVLPAFPANYFIRQEEL
jgi:4-diphosphocytidyl-2-C-methyl-D-erythritol kinase